MMGQYPLVCKIFIGKSFVYINLAIFGEMQIVMYYDVRKSLLQS